MLKVLLRSRLLLMLSVLTGATRTKKAKTTGQLLGFALLMVLSLISLGFFFFHIFDTLSQPFHLFGLDWLYFALGALFAFALMLIGNVFAAKAQLYEAKDNDLLLSMPIKPVDILLSRLFLLWVLALVMAVIVAVPTWISSAISLRGWHLAGFLVVFLLILPLLNLAVSSLLGWLIHLASQRAKNKSLVTILLSIVFLGGYMLLSFRMNAFLTDLAAAPQSLAGKLGAATPLVWVGRAVAEGKPLDLVNLLLPTLILFALTCLLLSRTFIRTATNHRGEVKRRYVERTENALSPQRALLHRELQHLWASPAYLLNSGMGALLMVLGMAALLVKRTDLLALAQNPELAGLFRLIFLVALCFMAIYTFLTAPSISLEGKSLWILRSLPMDTWKILRSKLILNLVFGLPLLLLSSAVLGWALSYRGLELLFLVLLPVLYLVFISFLGLFENLRHPNFAWTNETQAVKSSMSVLYTMLIGMASVLVPVLAYILFSDTVSVTQICGTTLVLLSVLSLLLWRWLRRNGVSVFESL